MLTKRLRKGDIAKYNSGKDDIYYRVLGKVRDYRDIISIQPIDIETLEAIGKPTQIIQWFTEGSNKNLTKITPGKGK